MAGGQRDGNTCRNGNEVGRTVPLAACSALHRLGEVRRQEGVSRRTVARGLGISIAEVKLQERETTDLPLSTLHRWQKVLNVPLAELLVEPDESLSLPLMKRARLVQLMKTVMSIMEQAKQTSVKRFAQTMIGQLTEIMPELREISSWPVVGQRRRCGEYGRAADHSLPEEVFTELAHDVAWHILEP